MIGGRPTIYTIGHSTHELGVFIGLLKQNGVTAVADVRSHPYSRIVHFSREPLEMALKAEGIQYVFLGRELGARRDEQECYVDGQAVYERIAELPLFREGMERLARGAEKYAIAMMCAEKEPLDCHRTILICRHLRKLGLDIRHILADGVLEHHEQTEKRLIEMMDLNANLFEQEITHAELIERAYDARSKKIAYRADQEGVSQ